MTEDIQSPERILRRPEVEKMTGLSRSSIYAFVKNNTFPKNLMLGPRAVGWRESAVLEWIEARKEKSGEN